MPKSMTMSTSCHLGGVELIDTSKLVYKEPPSEIQRTYASGSHSGASSSKCTRLNDSVFELHAPTEATIDVLFFHGFQLDHNPNLHLSTWTCSDGSIWPQSWLPEAFPTARILTISYDSSLRKTEKNGRMDLYVIAESLLHNLFLENVGVDRLVILVGHSLGGLVIKELCEQAYRCHMHEDKPKNFLRNVGAIFFYGTPHIGAPFANSLKKDYGVNARGELVRYLEVFNNDLSRLHDKFQKLVTEYPQWRIAGVGESRKTDLGSGTTDLVVPEASARWGDFMLIDEDHFSLCQPQGKDRTNYRRLVDFIREAQQEAARYIRHEGDQAELCRADLQPIPLYAVGLNRLVKKIERLLETESVVGLWGMGGVGKTTLAKAVFNELSSQFEYTLFADVVKEISGDVEKLEKKLLSKVNHYGKEEPKISWNHLRGKKTLVIMDDVATERDTTLVVKWCTRGGTESKFILTSRDRGFLNRLDKIYIHEVKSLDPEMSKDLFISHAFSGNRSPPESLMIFVDKIVQKCEGLPLTLEVLGKFLKTASADRVDLWEQTSNALGGAEIEDGLHEVWPKLKLSYDSLKPAAQQMFLDAASFFSVSEVVDVGMGRPVRAHGVYHVANAFPLLMATFSTGLSLREAKASWEVQFKNSTILWQTLVDRSLVYDVRDDSPVRVHEHLRTLALKVGAAKRLQLPSSSALADYETARQEIVSLQIQCQGHAELDLDIATVQKMKNLRYVELIKCNLVRNVRSLSRATLPAALVVFKSTSSVDCSSISFATCNNLTCLDVEHVSWEHLPDSFGQLKSLQTLKLGAPNLVRLPDAFGKLEALRVLKLSCMLLKCLPESFGKLRRLEHLVLNCPELQRLPDSVSQLKALKTLYLQWQISEFNYRLKQRSRGCLTTHIPFSACGFAPTIGTFGTYPPWRASESLGGLEDLALEEMVLVSCYTEALDDSFGNLIHLRALSLGSCDDLRALPSTFGKLTMLEYLGIEGASRLETLPDSIQNLQLLNNIHLDGVGRHTNFQLPETIGQLPALKFLCVKDSNLTEFPTLQCATGMKQLILSDLPKLVTIRDQPFSRLDYLDVSDTPSLEIFPNLGTFTTLKTLHIGGAPKILTLPDMCLPNVTDLRFWNLNVAELPSFSSLLSLTLLSLVRLPNLTILPELKLCKLLRKLKLVALDGLKKIPSLQELTSVRNLRILTLPELEAFPEVHLLSLEKMKLSYLPGLAVLPCWLEHASDTLQSKDKLIKLTFTNNRVVDTTILPYFYFTMDIVS